MLFTVKQSDRIEIKDEFQSLIGICVSCNLADSIYQGMTKPFSIPNRDLCKLQLLSPTQPPSSLAFSIPNRDLCKLQQLSRVRLYLRRFFSIPNRDLCKLQPKSKSFPGCCLGIFQSLIGICVSCNKPIQKIASTSDPLFNP